MKKFSKKISSVIKVDEKKTELNNPQDDWNSLDLKHISLYSYKGQLSAYIDTYDENNVIYVFKGDAEPVAYLSAYENYYAIYGFNGNHLGWYEDGIIRDFSKTALFFHLPSHFVNMSKAAFLDNF